MINLSIIDPFTHVNFTVHSIYTNATPYHI